MITKTCECGVVFEYEPPKNFADNRKYCDKCRDRKKAEYEARMNPSNPIPATPQPVNAPVQKVPATGNEVVPETGNFQSTVWNHEVEGNIYKFGVMGKAGQKFYEHRIKYETPEDLKMKLADLGFAGFTFEEVEEFKPEHIPHD